MASSKDISIRARQRETLKWEYFRDIFPDAAHKLSKNIVASPNITKEEPGGFLRRAQKSDGSD
jgi:hypothetical protein